MKDKNSSLRIILFIIAFPAVIGFFKALPSLSFYKEFKKEKLIISSLKLTTNIQSRKSLNFSIINGSKYRFKDMVIECIYRSNSGTVLGESDYTIYKIFHSNNVFNNSAQEIRGFVISDMPQQSSKVNCVATGITILSKDENKAVDDEIINKAFGDKSNI